MMSVCVMVMMMMLAVLPRLSLTMGVAVPSNSEDEVHELSKVILQLTQRFATMEVNLESRLSTLTDSAAKGEALFESLSTRLAKVDDLVEKVEALDTRLTQETSSLRSTITTTNTDLQAVSMKLASMEVMTVVAAENDPTEMRLREEEEEEHEEGEMNEDGTRSSLDWIYDTETLSSLITRSVAQEVKRTLPALLDRSLSTLQESLYKRLSKSVGQLQEEVKAAREELEELGSETLTTATGTRQDIKQGGKATQDAVTDIKNKIQSVHRDLALKITSSPSLSNLEPMLRQVNHSLVETIARAAAGLNFTLLEGGAGARGRAGGTEGGEGGGEDSLDSPQCPDSTTVAALVEVKHLLESLLRKSESLRRGLNKMTSEGLDLLKLLHQRFGVLVRRMNTKPEYGQMLLEEMEDLNNLVESSYMTVMMAQTAFNDSCKKIQEEEPLLERKMTELLDKLVTNVDLGYQHNRQQLTELKEVVMRLGQRGTLLNITQEPVTKTEKHTLGDAAYVPSQVQQVILMGLESANHTVAKLEVLEEHVDTVVVGILSTEWTDRHQKDMADQLVTSAKDLMGYAQEQILQSLDLYKILYLVLEQFNRTVISRPSQDQPVIPTVPPFHLLNDAAPFTLPPTCTAALIQQINDRKAMQRSDTLQSTHEEPNVDAHPAAAAGLKKDKIRQEDVVVISEEEDEENVPAWYTNPTFLSGNYGTPDKGLPVFREEDWIDIDEMYDTEPDTTSSPPPPPPSPSITSSRPTEVDRYFGVS